MKYQNWCALGVGCGMMWADRHNQNVIFGDQRNETITITDRSNGKADGTRTLIIDPDVQLDFRELPYPDNSFNLVAFDPPPSGPGRE